MPLAFSTSSKMSTNFFSTILTHHPPQIHPNTIFPFQKSLKNFIRQLTPTASLFYQLATPQIFTMRTITFQKWNNFQNSVTNSSLNFCNFNNCEKSAFCLSIFITVSLVTSHQVFNTAIQLYLLCINSANLYVYLVSSIAQSCINCCVIFTLASPNISTEYLSSFI